MIKGAAYIAWAPIDTESENADPTYGTGFQIGGLNQIDRKINYDEAALPADNKLKYKAKQFKNGDLAIKLSEFSLANQAAMFGQTISNGKLSKRDTDIPPMAGIGYINTVGKKDANGNDVTIYRVYINPKTQSYPGDTSAKSGGDGISLATEDLSATIYQPEYAEWEINEEYSTFTSAVNRVKSFLSITNAYAVNVQVNGDSTGEAATPEGVTVVATGDTFTLTITGTVTTLYDNGTDVTASIADGAYTITVTDDHDIAVIF